MLVSHEHVWAADGACTVTLGPGVRCHARRCAADECAAKAMPLIDYCLAHRGVVRMIGVSR